MKSIENYTTVMILCYKMITSLELMMIMMNEASFIAPASASNGRSWRLVYSVSQNQKYFPLIHICSRKEIILHSLIILLSPLYDEVNTNMTLTSWNIDDIILALFFVQRHERYFDNSSLYLRRISSSVWSQKGINSVLIP